jgi:hypothetical protein
LLDEILESAFTEGRNQPVFVGTDMSSPLAPCGPRHVTWISRRRPDPRRTDPSKLIPDVSKNAAIKIVHRLHAASDDRQAVGATRTSPRISPPSRPSADAGREIGPTGAEHREMHCSHMIKRGIWGTTTGANRPGLLPTG